MPNVNPDILVWARETAGLTMEDAVQKLNLRETRDMSAVDRLVALENGEVEPSRPMLLKMVKQYRRPLLTFYMTVPPRRGDRGQDFRTLPEEHSAFDEALLDTLIRDVQARQSMLRSALEDEDDIEPVTFVGSAQRADGFESLARSIQQELDLDIQEFRSQPNQNTAFNFLRGKAEDAGVFVLLIGNLGSHHTAIDVEVFRGFTISDDLAPFIVINDQDSHAAWSFTLLHELAHLWLGQTGVSGATAERAIERFCNDVAGEILLPEEELLTLGVNHNTSLEVVKSLINEFADSRNVSHSMVTYKLYSCDAISRETWSTLSNFFRRAWLTNRARKRSQRGEGSGPNYFVVRRHRLGPTLVNFIGRMMHIGSVTTTQAGKILGVKPGIVHKVVGAY